MALIEKFIDPLFMVAFFGIVELLKYLGIFKAIEENEDFEQITPDFFKDVKRLAIFIIGLLVMVVFMISKFETLWTYAAGEYLVKLLVSLALTTTCYEMLLKHVKKALKRMFTRKI